MRSFSTKKISIILAIIVLVVVFCVFILPYLLSTKFNKNLNEPNANIENVAGVNIKGQEESKLEQNQIVVTHIATPTAVKAVYISAWTAGSAKQRDRILDLVDTTEINSLIIDIKDSTGRVSFHTDNKLLNDLGASEKRISDIKGLIDMLHKKNIYVIGRISVFQDPYMTKKKPDWAITRKSDGSAWKDRKGLSFLDPANKEVWEYITNIAHTAYDYGFDEINFDYIRYPSDGNLKDINYHIGEGKTRASNIEDFFVYLHDSMKKDANIPISADLFGLVTVNVGNDDMGIGQIMEKALPHFDFIAPMVYPSHFAKDWNGYKNSAEHPYEVVNITMKSAIAKSAALGMGPEKIRPWLQDFSIGGTKYTKEMVRAQIKATYDSGLTSWMLWDPANRYTKDALEPNE